MSLSSQQQAHLAFLNAYYSKVYRIYDVSRKYFLFGRDSLLTDIIARQPQRVIEVGCGTGRNLAKLKHHLPNTEFGGVEPCDTMRTYALQKYPWLNVSAEMAETIDLTTLLSEKADIIFLSYALSMMQQPEQIVARCRDALADNGQLYVVDFGKLDGLKVINACFMKYLQAFHVHPEKLDGLFAQANQFKQGPWQYWRQAVFYRL